MIISGKFVIWLHLKIQTHQSVCPILNILLRQGNVDMVLEMDLTRKRVLSLPTPPCGQWKPPSLLWFVRCFVFKWDGGREELPGWTWCSKVWCPWGKDVGLLLHIFLGSYIVLDSGFLCSRHWMSSRGRKFLLWHWWRRGTNYLLLSLRFTSLSASRHRQLDWLIQLWESVLVPNFIFVA